MNQKHSSKIQASDITLCYTIKLLSFKCIYNLSELSDFLILKNPIILVSPYDGRLCFIGVCLFRAEGNTQPLVPGPFPGSGSRSFLGREYSCSLVSGSRSFPPQGSEGRGYPCPGHLCIRTGVPLPLPSPLPSPHPSSPLLLPGGLSCF